MLIGSIVAAGAGVRRVIFLDLGAHTGLMRTLTRLVPLGLVAVGLSVPSSTPIAGAAPVQVTMFSHSFSPATVTVSQCGSVTWTNNSGLTHTATSNKGFWARPLVNSGSSANRSFQHAGSFGYFCEFHDGMTGTVRVPLRAPASAANGFALRWSAVGSSLTNRRFGVQKNPPGTDTPWTALRTNTTTRSAFLNPTRNGTWRYRARTDNTSNLKSSGWSPVKLVKVS
jgi:plastocyanin